MKCSPVLSNLHCSFVSNIALICLQYAVLGVGRCPYPATVRRAPCPLFVHQICVDAAMEQAERTPSSQLLIAFAHESEIGATRRRPRPASTPQNRRSPTKRLRLQARRRCTKTRTCVTTPDNNHHTKHTRIIVGCYSLACTYRYRYGERKSVLARSTGVCSPILWMEDWMEDAEPRRASRSSATEYPCGR